MVKFANFYSNRKGFTLIELSISITVMMLLVFSFSKIGTSLLSKNTSLSEAHIFYHNLSDKRFEALATNSKQLLPTNSGEIGFTNYGVTSKPNSKIIEKYKITLGVDHEDVNIKKTK